MRSSLITRSRSFLSVTFQTNSYFFQQSAQESLENFIHDIIKELSREASGPEMEVFKLLMEIVKETSSIVRKDDQLLSLLQTVIKKEVGYNDNFQPDSEKSMMQLVDENGGIKDLQNTTLLDNDLDKNINKENITYETENIPKKLKRKFQKELVVLNEFFDSDLRSKAKFDSGKIKKILSAYSNLRSTENSKDRKKRESQTKSEITPELMAYLVDQYLQEDQSKVSKCLIQILWTKDGKYEEEMCSKISLDLGKKVRKLLFMILKKELPSSLFFLDFEIIMKEFMSRGQELEKDLKTLAMKFLQPITGEDLREILTPIVKIFEKPIFGNENIDNLFNGILRFIIKTESLNKLSAIIRQIQKEIIMK